MAKDALAPWRSDADGVILHEPEDATRLYDVPGNATERLERGDYEHRCRAKGGRTSVAKAAYPISYVDNLFDHKMRRCSIK
jgi:hypothetical protein